MIRRASFIVELLWVNTFLISLICSSHCLAKFKNSLSLIFWLILIKSSSTIVQDFLVNLPYVPKRVSLKVIAIILPAIKLSKESARFQLDWFEAMIVRSPVAFTIVSILFKF